MRRGGAGRRVFAITVVLGLWRSARVVRRGSRAAMREPSPFASRRHVRARRTHVYIRRDATTPTCDGARNRARNGCLGARRHRGVYADFIHGSPPQCDGVLDPPRRIFRRLGYPRDHRSGHDPETIGRRIHRDLFRSGHFRAQPTESQPSERWSSSGSISSGIATGATVVFSPKLDERALQRRHDRQCDARRWHDQLHRVPRVREVYRRVDREQELRDGLFAVGDGPPASGRLLSARTVSTADAGAEGEHTWTRSS